MRFKVSTSLMLKILMFCGVTLLTWVKCSDFSEELNSTEIRDHLTALDGVILQKTGIVYFITD